VRMNVIHANKANTVGIVTDPDNLHSIGAFTPSTLKEWVKWVEDMYGEEQDVEIRVRKSDVTDGFMLVATSNGENPFVAVCGKFNVSGKVWENPLC
jgi:hypothetical protein